MTQEVEEDADITYPVPAWLKTEWDELTSELAEAHALISSNTEFHEEDHPRGQPENAGEFTKGAPASKASKSAGNAFAEAPGLPKGRNPLPRPSAIGVYTLHRWGKNHDDKVGAIKEFLAEVGDDGPHRDFKFYAEHGEAMTFKAVPEDILPIIAQAMKHQRPQQNACYYNSALWAGYFAKHKVFYCEGIMTSDDLSGPIQHAWLEVDGHVVDPSLIVRGDEDMPGLTYYGVRFHTEAALGVMAKEGQARPIALGPARTRKQRNYEDIEFL